MGSGTRNCPRISKDVCYDPTVIRAIVVLSVLCVTACGNTAASSIQQKASPTPQAANLPALPPVVQVRVATGPNGAQPQLTASPSGAVLSWVEQVGKTSTLKFSERTAGRWSAPRRVTSGDDWFISWADVPSVIRLSNGTLVAQWQQKSHPFFEAYNLRLAYSKDAGATWSKSFLPHHDGTTTQHGFASMFEIPGNGGLGLVWLDGRETAEGTTAPDGGAMALRYAAFDGAWKQTVDVVADPRVCECCSTSAAVTSDGVITAFRDRDGSEVRDIHVMRLAGGAWSEATTVHRDNWKIEACPVNGPAISARGRAVAVAWFTAVGDQPHSYAAFSSDAGRSWGPPIRLDDRASLGRVDIELLDDGTAVATWMEYSDAKGGFRARRIARTGARSAALEVAASVGGRATGHPHIGRAGNELVFAWAEGTGGAEDTDGQQLRTALMPLPR